MNTLLNISRDSADVEGILSLQSVSMGLLETSLQQKKKKKKKKKKNSPAWSLSLYKLI